MRKKSPLVHHSGYTPNHLLDILMRKLGVQSDAALARVLSVPPSTISKIRHKQVAINSALLLAAHEMTEMSIRELRTLMGDTGTRYWLGSLSGGINADTNASATVLPMAPAYSEQRRNSMQDNRQYA